MYLLNFRSRFLIKNLLKGLGALAVIVIGYVVLQKYAPLDGFLEYIGRWPLLVYLTFVLSEVVFGIIPPELFMIWSINHGLFDSYVLDVGFLALISYLAGVLGYFIGGYMSRLPILEPTFRKYIKRYQNTLNKYAGFLILVAAVTPLPFSAICMLVGATKFRLSSFLLIACIRFVRFAVYGFVIYQANMG